MNITKIKQLEWEEDQEEEFVMHCAEISASFTTNGYKPRYQIFIDKENNYFKAEYYYDGDEETIYLYKEKKNNLLSLEEIKVRCQEDYERRVMEHFVLPCLSSIVLDGEQ